MHALILNNPVELTIATVSLTPNRKEDVNLFRCINCGGAVAQYQGLVTKIYPNLEPQLDVLVIHKCRVCGKLYNFQSLKQTRLKPTGVILSVIASWLGYQTFWCYFCRSQLLSYNSESIVDLTTHRHVKVPFLLSCSGNDCHAKYYFSDIIEQST